MSESGRERYSSTRGTKPTGPEFNADVETVRENGGEIGTDERVEGYSVASEVEVESQSGDETSRIAKVATHTKKGFSALQKVVALIGSCLSIIVASITINNNLNKPAIEKPEVKETKVTHIYKSDTTTPSSNTDEATNSATTKPSTHSSEQSVEQLAPKNDDQTQPRTNQDQSKQNVRNLQPSQSPPKSNAESNTPSAGSNEASPNTPDQNPDESGAAEMGGVVEVGDTNNSNSGTQPASESNSGGTPGLQ